MRLSVFLTGLCMAGSAHAHVGHFGDIAGHDHWVAAGAIGAAIALAGWNILKGKKDKDAKVEPEADDELQEV